MSASALRRAVYAYLLLLLPSAWLAAKYDRYAIDGDAIGYMDLADLIHAHRWSEAVNSYWHPLYPALLCLAQMVFHPGRFSELPAYYTLNYGLFLLQAVAMLLFVRGLARLRERMSPDSAALFSLPALELIGLSWLTIAMMRELSLGKVRTDSLLQALILLAFAMLMESLSAATFASAAGLGALMGLFFGLAYLTKSFAFLLALLSMMVMVLFAWRVQKQRLLRTLGMVAPAFVVFLAVAGPYVAALSHQKHRFDFGDSGSLNYAWYVSGTEKMHLEPWMTDSFGSAKVHLVHPERQLMASPGVYSYKALSAGTYPPWFDTTYFNEHITPVFSLKRLVVRDARNAVLIVRYVLNHPEGVLLLAVLLVAGASLHGRHRFAWPMLVLGALMWAIYAMVNVEERYVTAAYLVMLLPMFAALTPARGAADDLRVRSLSRTAGLLVLLFAMFTLGELLREDLANRRDEIVRGDVPAWRYRNVFDAAEALGRMGVAPGAEIACIGEDACLNDFYWARLAGVRILTEIYEPVHDHLIDRLDAMPNREQVYATVRNEGAQVLVGSFDPGAMNASHAAAAGWVRLGETTLYALPLQRAAVPGGGPR